jgi:GNAT superfamily N-acetyltransferase
MTSATASAETPTAVATRTATAADLPAVLALYGTQGLGDAGVLTHDEARAMLERFRAYPDYRLYVATARGEIVGSFALLIMENLAHRGAPSGIVEDVVVREDWRGRGVGTRMMRFALERCRHRGCYKLALSSHLVRTQAHRFFASLGFSQHGLSFVAWPLA